MTLEFKPLDINSNEQLEALANWDNDPELNYLTKPRFDEQPFQHTTAKEIKKRFLENPKSIEQMTMIYFDQKLIGNFNINFEFHMLMRKEELTCWLGITIGREQARGKGLGRKIMAEIEKQSKEFQAKRIELGVFEFNKAAIGFYEKVGFQEIGRIPNFCYWNGKMWDDIRMEKRL